MSKPANKTIIGIFVVVAIALVVVAVLLLGSGKFFKNNPKVVMYFKGSVKGLAVGSPVVFRGVKVGSVTEIKMLFNPKDLSVMIPVYAELERGSLEAVPSGESMEAFHKAHSMNDFIQELIKRGLRAQLDMQSIVTGQLMVSLDFYSDRSATLVGADTRYPEIPTIPTTMQQLAERLEKIPIDEIVAKLNSALGGIDKLVNSPEMAGTIKSVRQAVDDTRSLVQNLDGQVKPLVAKMTDVATNIQTLATRIDSKIDPLATSITKASDEVAVTLKRAQTTMGTIEDLAGEDSMVTYRLEKTLEELESAARALKLLADTLQQQPDAIIFGKKNTRGK